MREHVGRAPFSRARIPPPPLPLPRRTTAKLCCLFCFTGYKLLSHQFSPVISILLPWGKHRISFKSDCNPATRIGYVRKLSRYSNICSQIGHCDETIGEGGTTLDLKALHLGAVIFLFLFVFPFLFFFCLFSAVQGLLVSFTYLFRHCNRRDNLQYTLLFSVEKL